MPRLPQVLSPLVRILVERAKAAGTRGDNKVALRLYAVALAALPSRPDVHDGIISLLRDIDAGPPAAQSDREGREVAAEAVRNGDTLRDAGDFAGAAAAYQSALDLAPARADIRVQLGNMLKDCGRLADAEMQYRRAMEERPADADLHVQLGHVHKLRGERPAAVAAYRRALELDPCCASALIELAEGGQAASQERIFEAQLRAGSTETLITIGYQLKEMRARLDGMARLLPEATGRTAFPIALYPLFRDSFPVPAPPPVDQPPHFTILLLVDREPLDTIHLQLLALRGQAMGQWTLVAIGSDAARRQTIALAAAGDPRIGWMERRPGETDAQAERRVAAGVASGWIVLLAAGAVLDHHALGWFAAAVHIGSAAAFIADEEVGTPEGGNITRSAPVLRQVVDHDALLECNVCGETMAVRSSAYAEAAPALTIGSVAASRSSLLLALSCTGRVGHIPYPLVWRTADGADTTATAAAHEQAVRAHIAATGLPVAITAANPLETQAVHWLPKTPAAAMAVIIATRDNAGDVRIFVDSLIAKSARPEAIAFLIVDNGSQDAAQQRILAELSARDAVTVLRDDQPFNWSRLNNRAAEHTDAPLLVFANDDMRMLSSSWDATLRGLLERAEIGAVGARLLYDDDTIQHAGVLFGWCGTVIHDGLFEPASEPGPARRWHVTRAASAVTGAFLATRRDDFVAHGRFDEVSLPVSHSDIDYALKLRNSGLKILVTPRITLVHHESKSRGLDHLDSVRSSRNRAERHVMASRWGDVLDADPCVNPTWRDSSLPFRLIAAPSAARVEAHIAQCARPQPWRPARETPTACRLSPRP